MEQSTLTPTGVVAARVREMRSERQWSAEKVAKEMNQLGVPWNRGVVTKLETGHRDSVSVAELLALACVFKVSPLALLLPSEADGYDVTPNRPAHSTIRILDWMLGRTEEPFGAQNHRVAWVAVPAGLPELLSRREFQLAKEQDQKINALQVRNAELEATLKTRPAISGDTLLSLIQRIEEATEEAVASRERQLKLWKAIALYASDEVREAFKTMTPLGEIFDIRELDEADSAGPAEG